MKLSLAMIALLVGSALLANVAAAQPPDNLDPFAQPSGTSEAPPAKKKASQPADAPQPKTTSSDDSLEQKLQEAIETEIGTVPLSEFVGEVSRAIEAPVFFQPHPELTEVNDGTSITLESSGLPLKAELTKALRPHALRAIVHHDALLIIADTAELARRGLGTDRYVTVDDRYMQELAEKLAAPYSQNFNEIPLNDAMRILSEETGIRFMIDRRGLEDIGLTVDVPITIDLSDVSVYEFLQLMLRDPDLTLLPRSGYVLVTTLEEADSPSNQIIRVYWLDGTGLATEMATEAIEISIEPDTWEALGGPSTKVMLTADKRGRSGLLVTTRYAVHRQIENLLHAIRQGVVDPGATFSDPPCDQTFHGPYSHAPMGGIGGGGMMRMDEIGMGAGEAAKGEPGGGNRE